MFVQITRQEGEDLAIPGADYSFNTLKRAQALGDFQALKGRGRRAVRLHITGDLVGGLRAIRDLIEDAVAVAH